MAEPQVGPEEFLTPGRDLARARMVHTSLRALAGGGAGSVLQEMAREVLSGRMGLGECLSVDAYAETLTSRAVEAYAEWERLPDADRERHMAEARRFLDSENESESARGSDPAAVPPPRL
ncbi:hypothetical protein [Streptomyces sp. ISL-11]|uniref:hypothetical protein n=1 Tax=Streptomyces sp. ISL-11 TaxID=2819174 RepID=UPI001BEB6B66|nr:hypothetical protein [Streptomyces sp. ISL-11]MBT2387782.1 hypothetical protein [Streptomyces sp. ISL-11]